MATFTVYVGNVAGDQLFSRVITAEKVVFNEDSQTLALGDDKDGPPAAILQLSRVIAVIRH